MPRSGTKKLKTQSPHDLLVSAFDRADRPEATAADLRRLRRAIEKHPEDVATFTDLVHTALLGVVKARARSPAREEALIHSIRSLQKELGRDSASRPEQLLIAQVAACAVRMHYLEQTQMSCMVSGHEPAVAAYLDKRLSSAQHRYLRAIETLMRVRNLLRGPQVQLNVATHGGQQIVANAGGS